MFTEPGPTRICDLIRVHSFGVLVKHAHGPNASHLPFLLREEGDGFVLCEPREAANAQCAALDGCEALAVFSGPHAYVSPGWYEAQPAAPTWNYAAV